MKKLDIEKMKEMIKTGDYYSKDLQTKEILIIRKKVLDEVREVIYKDVFNDSDVCDVHDFILGIMRDMIQENNYIVIPAKDDANGREDE